MKSLSLSFALMFCAATCFAQTKADSSKVIQIINKSEEAYTHLKTYTDSGKLIQTIINNGSTSKTALIFKTAYTSAGDFNFEYYKVGQSNSLYTINRSANVIKTWWGITNQETTPPNISNALYAAVGVSSSTSVMIPEFLLRTDFKGQNFYRQLKTYTLEDEEKVNGTDCYKIKGYGVVGAFIIWISKKDFLIRKIDLEKTVDPAKTEANVRAITETFKKKDSARYNAIIKANKLAADIRGMSRHPFVVKGSYTFTPVINHKIRPELLKFRPNREVAL